MTSTCRKDGLRLAFIKQPWTPIWTRESTRFTAPDAMLDAHFYKSCNLSLLLHFGGDAWVVGDEAPCPTHSRAMWEEADTEALAEVYEQTATTKLDDIPWGEYDIVLAQDLVIPKRIIEANPCTLWCRWEAIHASSTFGKDLHGYDLFWDFTLESPRELTRLPQMLSLPFMVNADILRGMVRPTHEDAVFVPSRAVRPHGDVYPLLFGKATVAGLPMRHDRIWNLRRTWRAILDGRVETTREHFANVGSCKYLLNIRDADIGQPIIEAAALGLIVVSAPEKYAVVCHPYCRVADLAEGIHTISRLQQAPSVQQEILQYQDTVLEELFWNRPLSLLGEALEMKREQCAQKC